MSKKRFTVDEFSDQISETLDFLLAASQLGLQNLCVFPALEVWELLFSPAIYK